MARIAGNDLPVNKKGRIGLTYIFGIGHSTAKRLLTELEIDPDRKISDWNDDELTKLEHILLTTLKLKVIYVLRFR